MLYVQFFVKDFKYDNLLVSLLINKLTSKLSYLKSFSGKRFFVEIRRDIFIFYFLVVFVLTVPGTGFFAPYFERP